METSLETALPWEELERGQVDDEGTVTRKCTTDYLAALYVAYIDLLGKYGTGKEDYTGIPYESLRAVVEELSRLTRHPSLFPSNETRSRYLMLLESLIRKHISEYDEQIRRLHKVDLVKQMHLLVREEEKILQSLNRPTFKPDLLPWEQFLLKESPGSGVLLSEFSLGSTQIMPVGGMALLSRWHSKTELIGEKWRVTKSRISASAVRKLNGLAKGTLPPSNLKYESAWISLIPNIYFERHFPTIKDNQAVDKLESFNSIIDLLETGRFNNYSNNATGIRAKFYSSTKKYPGMNDSSCG